MDLDNVQRELRSNYQYMQVKWGCLSHSLRTLIAVNTSVFFASRVPMVRQIVARHTMCGWQNTIVARRYHTVFTSVFAHASLLHLGFNCYATSVFAPLLEQSMYRRDKNFGTGTQATMFVIAAGMTANLICLFLSSVITPLRLVPSIGMSGGVYASMTVVAQREPDMDWQVLFLPRPVSSETFLSVCLGMDTIGLICFLTGMAYTGLAHHVHLAGACIGAASQQYILPRYKSRRNFWGW